MASRVHDDTACSALLAFTATSIRLAHGFQLTLDTPLGSLFQLPCFGMELPELPGAGDS